MALFSYKAALPSGEITEGQMEAGDREDVIRHLQSQGQIAIRADEVEAGSVSRVHRPIFQRKHLSRREVASFTVELATLLQAGLSLDHALGIMSDISERNESRQLIESLHEAVRAGNDLSEALSQQSDSFSDFYINMVRAGEAGGVLGATLQQLGEFLEHSQILQESVISKLIYPLVLIMVAGISIIVLLAYVVPQFSTLFAEADTELPWLTQVVMSTSYFIADYGWLAVLILLFAYFVIRHQYRQPQGRLAWDRRLMNVPLVRDLIIRLETARFARALSTLLGNGVPLLNAVGISRELVSNRAMMVDLERLQPALEAGEGLAAPLSHSKLVPELASHLIRVGEESGQLEDMLSRVANIFEREVENSLNRLLILLEPALILSLGVFVAGIILSILMAILSANELVF